jgi:hypothetical protein
MVNEPSTPAPIQRTFHRHLPAFLKPGDPSLPDARRGLPSAQQVFSLRLDDLSEKKPIDKNAAAAGWRFLIGGRSGNGLYATVSPTNSEAPELTGVSRGPEAAAAVKAKEDVQKLPDAEEGSYDLCILAIPGLLTECFWLKWTPEDHTKDLIVPFVTSQKGLMPMHAYKIEKFRGIAGQLAKDRLDAFKQLEEEELAGSKARLTAAKKKRVVWRAKPPNGAEPPRAE